MALKILPTEDGIPRIEGTFHLDPDRASLQKVRRALAGNDPEIPATRAMAILFESDFPNKHRDFEALLEDEAAPTLLRRLAAVYLGRLQTPEAVDVLITRLHTRDESILIAILQSLGVAGGRRAIEAITEFQRDLRFAAHEANVAAALIAHRIGIEGYELPIPPELRFLDMDRTCAGKLEFTTASRNDVEFCLRALGRLPFGIELSEQPSFQVRCQQQAWMILLNRDFVAPDALVRTARHKAILGVIATRSRETGLYSPSFVLLTTPAPGQERVRILACRVNGQVIFGGEIQVDGARANFSIRAVARPGAFAVSIQGSFADRHLRIDEALASLAPQVEQLKPAAEAAPGE